MRKFILKTITILGLSYLGLYLIYNWKFSAESHMLPTKWRYYNSHQKEISRVILGNSYSQFALDPEGMDSSIFNFSIVGSSLNVDSILFEYVLRKTGLKTILVEMSPGYMLHFNDEEFISERRVDYFFQGWRSGIDGILPYRAPIAKMKNKEFDYPLSEQGFITKNIKEFDVFGRHNLNEEEIRKDKLTKKTLKEHHHLTDEFLHRNVDIIRYFIKACEKRNVNLILFSTPKSKIYNDEFISQYQGHNKVISTLQEEFKGKFTYWDFSRRFETDFSLFKDVNHMNTKGAAAFTRIFADSLKRENLNFASY